MDSCFRCRVCLIVSKGIIRKEIGKSTTIKMGLDERYDTICLIYFLFYVTIFNYTVIVIFIVITNKRIVHPN